MLSSICFYKSFLQSQRFLQVSYFNFFQQIIYCLFKTLQEFQFQSSTCITILVCTLCILNQFVLMKTINKFSKNLYRLQILNSSDIFISILLSDNIQCQMYAIFQCLDCKSNKIYTNQDASFHFSLDNYVYTCMLYQSQKLYHNNHLQYCVILYQR